MTVVLRRTRRRAAAGVHRRDGMGTIFISHSTKDSDAAKRVRDWLQSQGWGDVFLDLDSTPDLDAENHRWLRALNHAQEHCSAVVLLISPAWLASRVCQREFQLSMQLGKRMFPVAVAPTAVHTLPPQLRAKAPFADVSSADKEESGFETLLAAMRNAGLHPSHFDWPVGDADPAVPYRGLRALDENDAGIFFGRDAELTRALDTLRRMRNGQRQRVFAVVARSGGGKSSFMRAGVLPRLRRSPDQFVVLPVVRIHENGARGVDVVRRAFGLQGEPSDEALKTAFDALRHPEVPAAPTGRGPVRRPPTLVLPIDRADRLLATDGAEVVALLARCWAVEPDLLVVLTIDDDHTVELEHFDRAAVGIAEFRLAALSTDGLMQIIQGPASIADPPIEFEADLSGTFLADLYKEDGLPLLSFTLERLARGPARDQRRNLTDYQRSLGGISGVINAAVTGAYERAYRDPHCPTNRAAIDAMARKIFIPLLVSIEHAEAPVKRHAVALSDVPREAHGVVGHLVDARLMTKFSVDGVETVELAHDAVFRNWWGLADWLRDERSLQERLQQIQRAADEWDVEERRRPLLRHFGDELTEAESMLRRPDLLRKLSETALEYLNACRTTELHENEVASRRRRRARWVVRLARLAAVGVIALVALAGMNVLGGWRQAEQDVSIALSRQSERARLAGHSERALRLAVLASSDTLLSPAALQAADQLVASALAVQTVAVLDGGGGRLLAGASRDRGATVVTVSRQGNIREWHRTAKSRWTVEAAGEHKVPLVFAAFDHSGTRLITRGADGSVRVWSRTEDSGWSSTPLEGASVDLAAFSDDGTSLATWSRTTAAVELWQIGSGGRWGSTAVGPLPNAEVVAVAVANAADQIVVADAGGVVWTFKNVPAEEKVDGADEDAPETSAGWRGASLAVAGRTLAAAFAPDGPRLLVAPRGQARLLTMSEAGEWEAEGPFAPFAPFAEVRAARFAPGATKVALVVQDGAVLVRPTSGDAGWRALTGHDAGVSFAAFGAEGVSVVTGANDGTARTWALQGKGDRRNGAAVGPFAPSESLEGHRAPIVAVATDQDGTTAVSTDANSTVRAWRGEVSRRLLGPEPRSDGATPTPLIAVSKDGKQIATAVGTDVRVWRFADRDWTSEALVAETAPTALTFSANGQVVAAASTAGGWAWRLGVGGARVDRVNAAAVIVDAAVSDDGSVRLTRTAQGRVTLTGEAQGVLPIRATAAALSPDGTQVITAGIDGGLWLWQPTQAGPGAPTRLEQRGFGDRLGAVESLSLFGDTYVAASAQGVMSLGTKGKDGRWTAQVVRAHRGPVRSAVFAGGAGILTWSVRGDGAARVWIRSAQGRWTDFMVPGFAIAAAAATTDGNMILVAPAGGKKVHRWRVQTDGPRGLTPQSVPLVCARRMAQTLSAPGAAAARRPFAMITAADLQAVPALGMVGMQVGDDVCRMRPDAVDRLFSDLVPRSWWSIATLKAEDEKGRP